MKVMDLGYELKLTFKQAFMKRQWESSRNWWDERTKVAVSTGHSRLGGKDNTGPADINLMRWLRVCGQKNNPCTKVLLFH